MIDLLKKLTSGVALAALLVGSAVVLGTAAPAHAIVGDPSVGTTPNGVTSVAASAGKSRGSGLWGYAGDVKTRASGYAFTYGVAVSPADESLWVTDSAKIVWTSNAFLCGLYGGVVKGGSACYVGESVLHRYALNAAPDWSIGQYQGNGSYGAAAVGSNAGVGANYAALSSAQNLNGTTMPSGRFGGVRGIAVTEQGTAWAMDADAGYAWLSHAGHALRMVNADGSEAGALGKTTWPSGTGWTNRHDPESFDYPVGIARMANGDMIVTSQTPELLKQYHSDGTFVRNIYLNQPAGTAYTGDPGYRSPYAIAVDPADGTLLVGYIDPGNGNPSFIQRVDPNNCVSEAVGNPAGSSRDRCAVLDTIGVGVLANGTATSSSPAVTFTIQVEPRTGDIYVGQRDGVLRLFAADGTPKGSFPVFGKGTGNGQVETVRGIAFDARGFMYVTVSEGKDTTRVQIFARTPDPITGLTAVYSDSAKTEATISWDALATGVTADAQAPVRDYVLEQSTDGGSTWSVRSTTISTAHSEVVTGLDPAQTYQFRVSAWNEAGNGDWAAVPVAEAPTHPNLTVVKSGNGIETATAADAVQVDAGSTVNFAYSITNTGDTPVEITRVNDSVLGDLTAPSGFSGALGLNESVEFLASGAVPAGAYRNTVSVEWREAGTQLALVPKTDDWFGFGVTRDLSIVKTGNGELALTEDDRVNVAAGANVAFNYTITNNGNVPVTGLALADDVLGSVQAPAGFTGTLDANGGSVTFTATAPVPAGAYVNTATATGSSAGRPVSAETRWHGFGVTSDLSVVKTGNGVATASADQPYYTTADATVQFEYAITNNGNADVTITSVNDDVLGTLATPVGFSGVLGAGASVTYFASGQVPAGDYHNTVIATATAQGGGTLSASDEWFGFGVTDDLSVVKSGDSVTNDSADDAHRVVAGSTVEFVYVVTNSGNAPVALSISDDRLGQLTPPPGFSGTLGAGQSVEFKANGAIPAGDYHNTATVDGRSSAGVALRPSDDWFGFGVTDGLTVVKTGNGIATASEGEAVHVAAGSLVEFSYTVTNDGNSPVVVSEVRDDRIGQLSPPAGFGGVLGANESVDFIANGSVPAGSYRNIATVTAENEFGAQLTASDDWFGFGDVKTPENPGTNEGSGGANGGGQLPNTGAAGFEPLAIGAGLLLLSGAALVLIRSRSRRRRAG